MKIKRIYKKRLTPEAQNPLGTLSSPQCSRSEGVAGMIQRFFSYFSEDSNEGSQNTFLR